MGWPEITYIIITTISLTISLVKHGEPSGKFSFGWALAVTAVMYTLLYFGGFFA